MTSWKKSVLALSALALTLALVAPAPAVAVIAAEEAFYNTWARTDLPVVDGAADRTWMWGLTPNTSVIAEPYAEHPAGERPVQYFDKARMEVNDPNIPADQIVLWYVTNGLMVVELVSGMMQVGQSDFEERTPAEVNIVGDQGDSNGPTYADIDQLGLRDLPAQEVGATITDTYTPDGETSSDSRYEVYGATAAHRVEAPGIDHTVASVFWEFMNSEGVVYDGVENVTDRLFIDPFYATGFPITGAFWSSVEVGGVSQDVLWQCFERRCLTYTPENEPGWQVEAGNVGLHYYEWRYDEVPAPDTHEFYVEMGTLNDSGVTGSALVTLNTTAGTLDVAIDATGLEPNQEHPQHIHGFDDFQQSLCPTPDMAGADGLIELEDGLPAYGDVVHSLDPAPVADEAGNISYEQSFSIADLNIPADIEIIPAHTIVLHGMTVDGEYESSLPVACGFVAPDVGFVSDLSGEAQLPVPVETEGDGFATFQLPADPTQLAFNLSVTGLEGVTMAHIHIEEEDGVGPVVVPLFDSSDAPAAANGIIASEIFGDLDFAGPLEGMSMMALIEAIDEGRAYVNVHTTANPEGEIRGTIERFVEPPGSTMQMR